MSFVKLGRDELGQPPTVVTADNFSLGRVGRSGMGKACQSADAIPATGTGQLYARNSVHQHVAETVPLGRWSVRCGSGHEGRSRALNRQARWRRV